MRNSKTHSVTMKKKLHKELSDDEKNFRWALNKYYYNSIKMSLKETYRRMIKDKYCDDNGKILSTKPSFRQFSYYYYKTVTQENLIISREGKGNFLRNHRVMLGSGIRDFCATIGYGMFDSTICDIFLVNDNFRAVRGLTRYGIIGGVESFKITGTAGVGKTSSIQRCTDIITSNKVLISEKPYKEIPIVIEIKANL